ncbi:MAG: hypothetical protein IJV51_02630 [Oscillospiraceae bacterium]|nr:hypothetical protein [Oscillospiraceae bacterium]
MKTYTLKHIVVGIMLVILTLGFCVVGTGAARPDPMKEPMGQRDFMPDGETPPEMPDGEFFPGGPQSDFEPADGALPPDGFGGFGPQHGFGRRGGMDAHGMDAEILTAIEALEDGETKTELQALYDKLHSAMEALMQADDSSRDAAETAVKEARDALNEALAAAGIEAAMSEPPAKPDGEMPFARPEGEDGMKLPEDTGNSKT